VTKTSYHHGNLRAALLEAAISELAESGIEGFTLRSCARRAGVSHGAPAHHFGDLTGLFTVLATDAFGQLALSMDHETAKVPSGNIESLVAVAIGYTDFALAHPDLFKLMFRTSRLNVDDPDLKAAGQAAIGRAATAVGTYYGIDDPRTDPDLAHQLYGLWSYSHGVASLILEAQFGPVERGSNSARELIPPTVRRLFSDGGKAH